MFYGPQIESEIRKACEDHKLSSINHLKFRSLKQRVLFLDKILQQHPIEDSAQRGDLISSIIEARPSDRVTTRLIDNSSRSRPWYSFLPFMGQNASDAELKKLNDDVSDISDAEFLEALPEIVAREPLLNEFVHLALRFAHEDLSRSVSAKAKYLSGRIRQIQMDACMKQIRYSAESQKARDVRNRQLEFMDSLAHSSRTASRYLA